MTDGEVVHKTKEPFGHKPLVELGGVAQAEPQTLADLCARYEREMNPDSVPGLIQRFDLRFSLTSRSSAARSGCGPSGQQEPSGAPGNGEEQDGCSGEDSQGADGDRGGKRL